MKIWKINAVIENIDCQYRKEILLNDEDIGFQCELLPEFPPCCEQVCDLKAKKINTSSIQSPFRVIWGEDDECLDD